MSKADARLTGDWVKAESLFASLITTVPEAALIMKSEAKESKNRLVRKLKDGSYNFQPLAESTKKNRGATPILIDTGSYVDAIDVVKVDFNTVAVGIKSNKKNGEGVSLVEIGLAHEYGARHLPPRPHWRKEYSLYRRSLGLKLTALLGRKISLAR